MVIYNEMERVKIPLREIMLEKPGIHRSSTNEISIMFL
jgi:hypothetical protein